MTIDVCKNEADLPVAEQQTNTTTRSASSKCGSPVRAPLFAPKECPFSLSMHSIPTRNLRARVAARPDVPIRSASATNTRGFCFCVCARCNSAQCDGCRNDAVNACAFFACHAYMAICCGPSRRLPPATRVSYHTLQWWRKHRHQQQKSVFRSVLVCSRSTRVRFRCPGTASQRSASVQLSFSSPTCRAGARVPPTQMILCLFVFCCVPTHCTSTWCGGCRCDAVTASAFFACHTYGVICCGPSTQLPRATSASHCPQPRWRRERSWQWR